MNQHVIPDAFAHGYLAHKTLSQHEKIAYGLLCSAQNTEISFPMLFYRLCSVHRPARVAAIISAMALKCFMTLQSNAKTFRTQKQSLRKIVPK